MSEPTDCQASTTAPADAGAIELPMRQRNALRCLLDKRDIIPEEIAHLDYKTIARASGIGKKSIETIRSWLNSHGYDLKGAPSADLNARTSKHARKLERSIDYLRCHGYEVYRNRE